MDDETEGEGRGRGRLGPYDLSRFSEFRDDKTFVLQRNPTDPSWKTAVVLGTGRSGTTMTAGVLMLLGVEFGDRTDLRLGDREISGCFGEVYRALLAWRVLVLRRRFRAVLGRRLARWKRFGFKSPDLAPFIWLLGGTIPAPAYVVLTRNLFETSFGFSRHVGGSWRRSMFTVTLIQCFLSAFVILTRKPVLVVSYEAALKEPEHFVDALSCFLDLEPDDPSRRLAIAHVDPGPGYSQLRRINGAVDLASPTRLAGWVVDARAPDTPVMLEVTTSAGPVAEARADLFRGDVRAAGRHETGQCGFDITFDSPLDPAAFETLSITVAGSRHVFWKASENSLRQ